MEWYFLSVNGMGGLPWPSDYLIQLTIQLEYQIISILKSLKSMINGICKNLYSIVQGPRCLNSPAYSIDDIIFRIFQPQGNRSLKIISPFPEVSYSIALSSIILPGQVFLCRWWYRMYSTYLRYSLLKRTRNRRPCHLTNPYCMVPSTSSSSAIHSIN